MMLNVCRVNKLLRKNFTFSSVFFKQKHVWSSDNVVKSPFEDIIVPDMTVNDYLWQVLDKWPTKTAMVCGITNRSYTYEEMYKKSQTLAANLRNKFKIKDGDTVGIFLENVPEYPIVFFGILAAGGIVATYNPVYTPREIQGQIIVSETKLMVTHSNLVPIVRTSLEMAKKDFPIVSIDINEDLTAGSVSYKELVEDEHADLSVLEQVNRNSQDVAVIPFSSGTTGLPKCVELSHRNITANCEQQNTECRVFSHTTDTHQDSLLSILPMFHAYGLLILMTHKLSAGLKLVTLPRFQPDTFLNAMQQYKINLLFAVPPMALFLGSNPAVTREHLENLNTLICGAAPLPVADVQKILDRCKTEIHFGQGYGMTEAAPLVSIAPRGCNAYETVGYALPNIQLRIVDANFKNLGPDEVGELLIRGPNIMKGYKNNPEANREVLLDNGWYRSGDLAKIDGTGLITIADRLKELIKVNAYQVPPAELESVVREHPAVFDAAVISVPDNFTGERPKAFIILKQESNATEEDIMKFVSERVAPYKKIKEVMFVDSIPKNPSGKILRRILKEKYCCK